MHDKRNEYLVMNYNISKHTQFYLIFYIMLRVPDRIVDRINNIVQMTLHRFYSLFVSTNIEYNKLLYTLCVHAVYNHMSGCYCRLLKFCCKLPSLVGKEEERKWCSFFKVHFHRYCCHHLARYILHDMYKTTVHMCVLSSRPDS